MTASGGPQLFSLLASFAKASYLRVAALELCRAALREQPRRRPKPYGTHGRGDSCKESTARKVMPDVH